MVLGCVTKHQQICQINKIEQTISRKGKKIFE